jgi:hypothetical protein
MLELLAPCCGTSHPERVFFPFSSPKVKTKPGRVLGGMFTATRTSRRLTSRGSRRRRSAASVSRTRTAGWSAGSRPRTSSAAARSSPARNRPRSRGRGEPDEPPRGVALGSPLPPLRGYPNTPAGSPPDPECALCHVANAAWGRPVRVAVSNSFGFGGSNTCLALEAVGEPGDFLPVSGREVGPADGGRAGRPGHFANGRAPLLSTQVAWGGASVDVSPSLASL